MLGFLTASQFFLIAIFIDQQHVLSAFQCFIAEGEPAYTKVCDLSRIINQGPASLEKLQISGGSDEFLVNERFELLTKASIDRESLINQKKCKNQDNKQDNNQINCILTIYLVVNNDNNQMIPVDVSILDVNDNVPKFDFHLANGGLKFKILENPADTMGIGQHGYPMMKRLISELPLANDPDYGMNASITYSLEGPDASSFSLEKEYSTSDPNNLEHLQLFITVQVDYEKMSEYHVNLIAYNNLTSMGHNYITKSVLPITVEIQDINEYDPIFKYPENNTSPVDNTMIVVIPESMPVKSKIYQVHASDNDKSSPSSSPTSSENNPDQIKFNINQVASSNIRSTFRMNEQDGSLFLVRKLDYESGERRFTIPILAVDSGYPPRTTSGTILVQIADVNDESPRIEVSNSPSKISSTSPPIVKARESLNYFSVDENRPVGSFIAKIHVSDKDSGRGGKVDCYLTKAKSFLNIFGYPPQTTPYSSGYEDEFKLVRLSSPIPQGDNYQSSVSFDLVTNKIFDREERDAYLVDIFCNDFGDEMNSFGNFNSKRLLSHRQISIKITDENDNGPRFAKSTFSGSIQEGLNSPERILTLDIVDGDLAESNKNKFRFSSSTPENILAFFQLDEDTGVVRTTNQPLDREVVDHYEFSVNVYDPSKASEWTDTCNVSISVLDKNDNAPELLQPAIFEVEEQDRLRENLNQKLFIGKINASDADLGPNGDIIYRIDTSQDPDLLKFWSIRSDGSIYAHVNSQFNLDREKQSNHHIPVILEDRGQPSSLSTSITVTVILLDVNDNSPIFQRPKSEVTREKLPTDRLRLSVETPVDTVIYQVLANDTDEGGNSQISYELQKSTKTTGEDIEYFKIDQVSGEIRLNHPLSLDDVKVPRQLIILASDGGANQSRKSFAYLYIEMVTQEISEREELLRQEKANKEYSLSYQNENREYAKSTPGDDGFFGPRSVHVKEYSSYSITEIAMGLGIGLIFIMAICLTAIVGLYLCNTKQNPLNSRNNYMTRLLCCGLCKETSENPDNLKFKASAQYQNHNCNYETLNVRASHHPQPYYTRANDRNWYQTTSRIEKSNYDFIVPDVKRAPTMSSINGILHEPAYSRNASSQEGGGLIHPVPRRLPAGFSALPSREDVNEEAYVYSTTLNNISPTTMTLSSGEDKSNSTTNQNRQIDTIGCSDTNNIICKADSNGLPPYNTKQHHAGYVIGSPNYSSSFV